MMFIQRVLFGVEGNVGTISGGVKPSRDIPRIRTTSGVRSKRKHAQKKH